ncbi:carotenoid oxygenase family protein [Ktedonosporobacter rubrisoli]|uniref:Carotenoid oxygenase family protein n=1 Tax=Ktedonosporobacter rubrisoli TaxID=2509675 RepID=A0A4P6JXW3_KTERU|nr:carotenoid oxygenase family protein [Ktedonosporobacter rubrisoli]QBD79866.1 carotenoid oxygenase family protein [Ktedonosporobacter rubrisoli]
MANHYRGALQTQDQEISLDHLPVAGQIPHWLSGTLLRNGPGKFEQGGQKYRHWFDGMAMLHRFAFHKGEVSYTNRFLRSSAYTKGREEGKICYSEFATDPCRSLFKRVASLFETNDHLAPVPNAGVNLARLDDAFIAMTETPIPVQFDAQTLETIGVIDFQDKLAGHMTTAHPHFDPAMQAGINYMANFSAKSTYNVFAFTKQQRRLIGSLPVREPAYMHSFGMTRNYIILVEFPLVIEPLKLMLSGKPFYENMLWKPERGARFLVMSKHDGSLAGTYESEAFFAFHHINAFEQDGDILVDLAAFPDARILDQLYMDNLLGPKGGALSQSSYRRYRLSPGQTKTSYEQLSAETIELPRINYERNNGIEYRFAYGVSQHGKQRDDFLDQLVKVDCTERSTKIWYAEGCYPGEPVFVAAPDTSDEDEGVVLSVIFDAQRESSFLLVLDARSFTELARAEVPQHIPLGFHGIYTHGVN